MVWQFEREGESLKWEIRSDDRGHALVTSRSDGTSSVERVSSDAELLARFHVTPQALVREGWRLAPLYRRD